MYREITVSHWATSIAFLAREPSALEAVVSVLPKRLGWSSQRVYGLAHVKAALHYLARLLAVSQGCIMHDRGSGTPTEGCLTAS